MTRSAEVSIIVARARNGVIGRDNALPWHLPNDLRRFKELTLGHAIIMGRRTYESIGRALPGRRSIVLSRARDFQPDGVSVARSLDAALELVDPGTRAFVIGGAAVFVESWPLARWLYLTEIDADIVGDVRLPTLDMTGWQQVEVVRHESDAHHEHPFRFVTYRRVAAD